MTKLFDLSNITTYQAAVQQSKAFRELKQLKDSILKPHGLTGSQWTVLGHTADAGKAGVRITALAEQLDTTQAFITNTVNKLAAKGYVERRADPLDSRVRIVVIKPKYVPVVAKIEQAVRAALRREIYSKVTPEELKIYVNVLARFAEKSPKQN